MKIKLLLLAVLLFGSSDAWGQADIKAYTSLDSINGHVYLNIDSIVYNYSTETIANIKAYYDRLGFEIDSLKKELGKITDIKYKNIPRINWIKSLELQKEIEAQRDIDIATIQQKYSRDNNNFIPEYILIFICIFLVGWAAGHATCYFRHDK